MLAPPSAHPTRRAPAGPLTRIGDAARLAVPSWLEASSGSLIWALLMGAAAWLSFILSGWQNVEKTTFVAAFFAAGGLLAFVPAIWIGRFLSRGRTGAGFAATLLALAVLTAGLTAFLMALQYRQYYAAWHASPFTIRWVFELVFTTASAVYQFLVLGLRAYFPCAFAALIAASWWNATRLR